MKSFKAYAKDADKSNDGIETFNEGQLTERLAERYPAPQYAFLPQVRNSTGYSMRRTIRTADALALGLWASRGLEMHGFEIKTFRTDWLNELKNPEKAEDIARFCHRWWIVAPANLVREGELPANWGLLVTKGNGLVCKKDAPVLKPKQIDYAMLAGILRNVSDTMIPRIDIQKEVDAARKDGIDSEKNMAKYVRDDFAALQKRVKEFEQASGVEIGNMYSYKKADQIGRAVKFVMENGPDQIYNAMRYAKESLLRVVANIDEETKKKLDSKEEVL